MKGLTSKGRSGEEVPLTLARYRAWKHSLSRGIPLNEKSGQTGVLDHATLVAISDHLLAEAGGHKAVTAAEAGSIIAVIAVRNNLVDRGWMPDRAFIRRFIRDYGLKLLSDEEKSSARSNSELGGLLVSWLVKVSRL